MMSGQKDLAAVGTGSKTIGDEWHNDCIYIDCTSARKDHSYV